jgi:hypothetical protein
MLVCVRVNVYAQGGGTEHRRVASKSRVRKKKSKQDEAMRKDIISERWDK